MLKATTSSALTSGGDVSITSTTTADFTYATIAGTYDGAVLLNAPTTVSATTLLYQSKASDIRFTNPSASLDVSDATTKASAARNLLLRSAGTVTVNSAGVSKLLASDQVCNCTSDPFLMSLTLIRSLARSLALSLSLSLSLSVHLVLGFGCRNH
jgi:hypothetical protein